MTKVFEEIHDFSSIKGEFLFLFIIIMKTIISWNCKGCASSKFPHIFREYNWEYKPDIVGLLEKIVSGVKAESIIASFEFHFSHHLEALGFSMGIWIGWKESVCVKIIRSHLQFVLI